MNSEAYLSSAVLNGSSLDPKTFVIALIAYDTIYVDKDLDRLPWRMAGSLRRFSTDGKVSSMSKEQELNYSSEKEVSDSSGFALTRLMQLDYNAFSELDGILRYIRKHPFENIREFFDLSFRQPIEVGKGTPVFHREMLNMLAAYYDSIGFNMRDDYFNRMWLVVVVQEFFVTHFLASKYGMFPILTASELEVRMLIKSFPLIPVSPIESGQALYSKYCDEETLQDMLDLMDEYQTEEKIKLVLELSVPSFEQIPLIEIIKLKKKDKFRSLARLAEDLIIKRSLTKLEFARVFVDELWGMAKILSPNIPEDIVGVLGAAPLPIPINPIGILSSINSVRKHMNFKKDYGWFITLSELRNKSECI